MTKIINIIILHLFLWLCLCDAQSHQPFASYIQHDLFFDIQEENIDCTLRLTFYGQEAFNIRKEMDADEDMELTMEDATASIEALQDRLLPQLKMQFAQSNVQWIPLYDPDCDFLNDRRVAPSPIVFTMHWFSTIETWHDSAKIDIHVIDKMAAKTPAVVPITLAYNNNSGEDHTARFPIIVSPGNDSVAREITYTLYNETLSVLQQHSLQPVYDVLIFLLASIVFMVLWRYRKRNVNVRGEQS